MASDTEFSTIKDLSCHIIPTTNQPTNPMFAMYKFTGNIFADVKSMATISIILLAHLIYHDLSCSGVTFLYTLDEFNAFILSSSFSLIGSILFGVVFINPVYYVVCCYKTGTFGHVF